MNTIKHTLQLEQALTARYILVYGEIETTDTTAGAIQTKVLKVIGNKPYEDIPEIVEIKTLEPFVVEVTV